MLKTNTQQANTKQLDSYFMDDYDSYSREADLQINFRRFDTGFFPEENSRASVDNLSFSSEGW